MDTNPLSVYVMHPFWNFVVKVRKTTSALCVYIYVCACVCVSVNTTNTSKCYDVAIRHNVSVKTSQYLVVIDKQY